VSISAALWNTDTTPWEGLAMHRTRTLNVQVQDGTLVLTDCAGKIVPFSKAQPVPKKVSMITLGALCGLPKRQRAPGFGCKSRPSSYESRHAVLQGTAADLLPKRTGPHTPAKRTKAVEARIIRTRCETHGTMYESAATCTQMGSTVSARLVGQVLADDGLSTKNG